jgi:hypothetical protein
LGGQQNWLQADSSSGFMDENAVLSIVFKPLIATITATLIPAATSVYPMFVMAR